MDDRKAEEGERKRLMGQRELDRNNGEQRRNAERDLEDSDAGWNRPAPSHHPAESALDHPTPRQDPEDRLGW
jgi:hypothetical protein